MKDGIIIQARTGSTRLPAKILRPFYGDLRIIDLMIMNIQQTCPHIPIVLATTDLPQDDVLESVAKEKNILCYRGSEEDVLERFVGAAEKFGVERLIRVCSDNPFLRPESFMDLFAEHEVSQADYVAFGFSDGRPTIKSHLGLYAELTTLAALKKVVSLTDEKFYHEHVTIYLYTHPDEFKVDLLPIPKDLETRTSLRFTLDTLEDFTLLQQLYAEFVETTDKSISELLRLIEKHPDCEMRMRENIMKNEK